MDDLEQRIRAHAHRIWVEEGRPSGREEAHWEMARELVAIEDNQRDATKPNPVATEGEEAIHPEPVEPIEAVEIARRSARPDRPGRATGLPAAEAQARPLILRRSPPMAQPTADPIINPQDRAWLVAAHDPAITLYVATEPVQRAAGGLGAKRRNLKHMLQQRLQAADLAPDRRQALLAAGEEALSTADFPSLDPGFALFLAEDRVHALPLDEAPPEDMSAVGHRFLLRPILDRFGAADRFHILAISAGGTRLIEATRETCRDVTPSGLRRTPWTRWWRRPMPRPRSRPMRPGAAVPARPPSADPAQL